MAFDGGFLYKVLEELKDAKDSHIDKIYQPSRDELVLTLRKKGFVKKLLITAKSGSARLHFTENRYENPQTPPLFCMVLRKHLLSARLVDIQQPCLERIAELVFSATNEMGDIVEIKLICELISSSANVILVKDGKILDALKRSGVEDAKRYILPGANYEYPEKQQKLNPLSCDIATLSQKIALGSRGISVEALNLLDGFSPLLCREIEHIANKQALSGTDLALATEHALNQTITALKTEGQPTIIYKDGTPFEFSYMPILQYGNGYESKFFESYSALLSEFYTAKDNAAHIKAAAHSILKLVTNLKSRTEKKLALRFRELESSKNRENLRIYGELIKANLYAIKNGSSFAMVQNYYDENLSEVKIPLNPALSPSKNADKYFKDYKKSYTAEQTLKALTEADREEIVYFDSVLDSIERCSTLSDLDEIRQELIAGGFIKTLPQKQKNKAAPKFSEFISQEGYKIIVGKNNLQNDYLTLKLAAKNDLWFHTKNIAGSHVIVFCGGKEVSDETILFAAKLAARNSKASTSSQVPVDYTPVKFVKKPNGAKPGMVIYTTNKTVFVNPQE